MGLVEPPLLVLSKTYPKIPEIGISNVPDFKFIFSG